MGYTTDFSGEFKLDRKLDPAHAEYLKKFNETRRMKRNANKAEKFPDPYREAVGLPIGEEGAYFVGGGGYAGQDKDKSIIEYNNPPADQPSLWCQWVPGPDGTTIQWDEREKFYDYINWLKYLIRHFLHPWKYTLNGEVRWQGEDSDDFGKIIVENNVVYVCRGSKKYEEAMIA